MRERERERERKREREREETKERERERERERETEREREHDVPLQQTRGSGYRGRLTLRFARLFRFEALWYPSDLCVTAHT